jgi:hypothetical protein
MKDQPIKTRQIARWLKGQGLQGIAAFLLEVGRPFAVLGAQAAYIVEPLFGNRRGLFQDLAHILEDPEQIDALMDQLHNIESESY